MRTRLKVKNTNERVILSDTLPYETPITFSNRFYYDFLIDTELRVEEGVATWKILPVAIEAIILLLLGINSNEKIKIKIKGGKRVFNYSNNKFITIPFSYGISHKEKSLRKLSVIHPRNQLDVISFYSRFKELIIYNSGISSFSLRAPSRIATTRFYDEEKKSSTVILSNGNEQVYDNKYKNLKSFFGYKKINNIHQFFESIDYHKCEKRYDHMSQLDISKCFDSIYTHSIAWAVLGKGAVKHSIAYSGGQDVLLKTFPDNFDRLLRTQNYNETNGILIGPEVSRIFAEIILQRIDYNLEKDLDLQNFKFGVDYDVYRYVDDYFVFFNDEKAYKALFSSLEGLLSEYKLGINSEKEMVYNKPIITEITIAKRKISDFLTNRINLELVKSESGDGELTPRFNVKSKSLITDFKMILAESCADYKSVINYTLTIVEARLKKAFSDYILGVSNQNDYKSFLLSIHSCLEFCFFIYTVAPRVNTTIKLSRILKLIIDFSRTKYIKFDDMHQVFKIIYDNVNFVMRKYESRMYTQVETLYLLTVISELGKDYWLSEKSLISYFGGIDNRGLLEFDLKLNYFSIVAIIFYVKNKKRYNSIKKAVKKTIVLKIKDSSSTLTKDSECFLLLMDCIACPHLMSSFKHYLLKIYGITSPAERKAIIEDNRLHFTKWENFDFGKELDAKQSDSVY
ncbi:antiviral reverse transcriptase Drt3b [Shewanella sp. SG41-3]|uniref:antiviral reverse transcriptase Drt3b n=1 Tax=Shewanella sp. SG41-3 TaxID=2760977 RepID=UPI00160359A6|nr:antiviral reverse transcriptase Drt3b [Shewanella sp. SG41-3]MBB1477733.1 RNA-directed DNA polymerase [Shewanella sp. SG41-3]